MTRLWENWLSYLVALLVLLGCSAWYHLVEWVRPLQGSR